MLINLLPITFFNEYIISPKTWLHYIKHEKKIITLFFYLCYFYYLHYIYSTMGSLIFITTMTYWHFRRKIIFSNLHPGLIYYFILYHIIIYSDSIKVGLHITIKELFIKKNITNTGIIEVIYQKINLINKISCLFILPQLFIKIILIPITSFLCLKILFLTTKYEQIVSYIIVLSQYLKIVTGINIGFLITISSQFLILFSQKISFLTLSIQLRNMNINFIQQYIKAYYSLYIDFLRFSDSRIQTVSFILYIRQINYTNFILSDL